jgi:cyanophycinase
MKQLVAIIFLLCIVMVACEPKPREQVAINKAQGKLFIIGGGKRSQALMDVLIAESGLKAGGYGLILPMASQEPDSAIYYSLIHFEAAGLQNVVGMDLSLRKAELAQLDSIRAASLIYISGGDQNRFMELIADTGVKEAIQQAYANGATIAGTSAGAAMMSEKMITGNEKKYPDYSSTFRHIEADNIEFAQGLGLIQNAIIDQHFVKRSRYNRLISAAIEHPDLLAIGIDESTALLVKGEQGEVVGESQIVVLRNRQASQQIADGKLGAQGLQLDILLPGNKFSLRL